VGDDLNRQHACQTLLPDQTLAAPLQGHIPYALQCATTENPEHPAASEPTCMASDARSAAAATTLLRSSCICPSSGINANRPGCCCWCWLNPNPWPAQACRPSSSGVSCSTSAHTGPQRWQKVEVLGQEGHCSAALQQARPACMCEARRFKHQTERWGHKDLRTGR
jgi:hypothetical protein